MKRRENGKEYKCNKNVLKTCVEKGKTVRVFNGSLKKRENLKKEKRGKRIYLKQKKNPRRIIQKKI